MNVLVRFWLKYWLSLACIVDFAARVKFTSMFLRTD